MSAVLFPIINISEIAKSRALSLPVNSIGLPSRAKSICIAEGCQNSYEAISLLSSKEKFYSFGTKTIAETNEAITNFIKKIESGSEDVIDYLYDFKKIYLQESSEKVIDSLPEVISLYFQNECRNEKERNKNILLKRFGIGESKIYTLEELGIFYGLTRERVRQIEEKCIQGLGKLFNNKLKNWKLNNLFYEKHQEIVKELGQVNYLILREKVNEILDISTSNIFNGYIDLYLEICNYSKLPTSLLGFRGAIKECWYSKETCPKKIIESLYAKLDFIYNHVDPISIFDLTIKIKKSLRTLDNNLIPVAVSATKDLVLDGDKVYVKLSELRSVSDKAYRILLLSGKPEHYSDIVRKINNELSSDKYESIKKPNLTNQLAGDKRFTPISKSGYWALSSWQDVVTITIIDTIKTILHKENTPLPFNVISDKVSSLRPDASTNSIKIYLNDKKNFSRVGKDLYALKDWNLDLYPIIRGKYNVTSEVFEKAVISTLKNKNPIAFGELIEEVSKITLLKKISVSQRINSSNGLVFTEESSPRHHKVVYCPNFDTFSSQTKNPKSLLRNQIQEEIRSILFSQPNIAITKGELFKELSKSITCIKPTFYSYLNEMNDIKQFKKNNIFYVLYVDFPEYHRRLLVSVL